MHSSRQQKCGTVWRLYCGQGPVTVLPTAVRFGLVCGAERVQSQARPRQVRSGQVEHAAVGTASVACPRAGNRRRAVRRKDLFHQKEEQSRAPERAGICWQCCGLGKLFVLNPLSVQAIATRFL
jgi:hypothetical protein